MAFVPKGYLPLTIAVERFAQALQISVESARPEMQGELYSGPTVASVMVPSTGQIELQHHNSPLHFRNIYIKELPAK